MDQSSEQIENQQQPPIVSAETPRKSYKLPLILGGIAILMLGLAGGYFISNSSKQPVTQVVNQLSPTSTINSEHTDPQKWETFTTKQYTFKYPSNVSPTDSGDGSVQIQFKEKLLPDAPDGYELSPGYFITFTVGNLDNKPIKQIAQEAVTKWKSIGTITKQLAPVTINEYNGYSFSAIGQIEEKSNYLSNGASYIQITTMTNDPHKKGYEEEINKIVSTFSFTDQAETSRVSITKSPQTNGASLANIKYTLPTGWKGEINGDKLLLTPATGGGYLSLSVHQYSGTAGRREYYCQLSNVCKTDSSFTAMTIGNISGYKADALDNSGGGTEYFGAKGNTFYIISSYNPPSPNEFEKSFQQVLNSLIF